MPVPSGAKPQPDIAATYKEMETLKGLSPGHPLIRLADGAIKKEYEVSAAIREALAPKMAPANEGAPEEDQSAPADEQSETAATEEPPESADTAGAK